PRTSVAGPTRGNGRVARNRFPARNTAETGTRIHLTDRRGNSTPQLWRTARQVPVQQNPSNTAGPTHRAETSFPARSDGTAVDRRADLGRTPIGRSNRDPRFERPPRTLRPDEQSAPSRRPKRP